MDASIAGQFPGVDRRSGWKREDRPREREAVPGADHGRERFLPDSGIVARALRERPDPPPLGTRVRPPTLTPPRPPTFPTAPGFSFSTTSSTKESQASHSGHLPIHFADS